MISKFFDNPTLTKLFSLFVAILIWLFVGSTAMWRSKWSRKTPRLKTAFRWWR